jgi:GNAT superfamily N-acetyltransferase
MDPRLRIADLAPGDRRVGADDWSDLAVHGVSGSEDPDFAGAFDRLWAEFGAGGEMERRDVIAARLRWTPARPVAGAALLYELLVLRRRGTIVAVRDHTAIVRLDDRGRPRPEPTIVHLSHALVEPAFRGSGLAAWLRALPLECARRCAAQAGRTGHTRDARVILVAEMEHPDRGDRDRMGRLRSYERAGFRKIDPAALEYRQPDFRAIGDLPGAVPPPLPLALVVRRVGAETENAMSATEVAAVVESIYAVYAVHVSTAALDPLRADIAARVARQPSFRLLPPVT